MYQREHSAILLTFIKQPVVIKIFILSIFEWPFYTGFSVVHIVRTGPRSAVGNVSGYRCVSDCRSRGREFDPGPVPYFLGDWS